MYTFRRPQQQQPPQLQGPEWDAGANDSGNPLTEVSAPPEDGCANPEATRQTSLGEKDATHQQLAGYLPEDATPEDALLYCRGMVQLNTVTAPPHWGGMRRVLPTTVPELHLIPSAPVQIQQHPCITPTSCIVLQLDGMLPEGMSAKEYSKNLVKYVMDLLAYQRATTAVTSLRFVKMGAELLQLVISFGRDVRLAVRLMEEFAKVGLSAGFAVEEEPSGDSGRHSSGKKHSIPPCATFQVTDYQFLLHEGKGITSKDVETLFQPHQESAENEVLVIPGFEAGVFYAAVKRPGIVYDWLWNPFCSFLVQYTLFERCGVLITMANCMDEFSQRTEGGRSGKRRQQELDEKGGTRRRDNAGRVVDEGHDDDDGASGIKSNGQAGDRLGDSSDGDSDHSYDGEEWMLRDGMKLNNQPWCRNAKEEVDIFGSLDNKAGKKFNEENLVDDEIKELFQDAKFENQDDFHDVEPQQGGLPVPYGYFSATPVVVGQPAYPPVASPLLVPFAPVSGAHPLSRAPHYGGVPPNQAWQTPPPAPPPQRSGELPSYQAAVMNTLTSMKEPKVEYPQLAEDEMGDDAREEPKRAEAEILQRLYPQGMYWAVGTQPPGVVGGPFPGAPYAAHVVPPIGAPMGYPPTGGSADLMPSILGQSTFGGSVHAGDMLSRAAFSEAQVEVTTSHSLPAITADDANNLAAKVVERVRQVFTSPTTQAGRDSDVTDMANKGVREQESVFPSTPFDITPPSMSSEVKDLVLFLEEHSGEIQVVLTSSQEEFQDACSRIVDALLIETSSIEEIWRAGAQLQIEEERENSSVVSCNDVRSATDAELHASQTKGATGQYPALLPYLLANGGVIQIVTALATKHAWKLLPLLACYILPFLMDPVVVQSVCVPALHNAPSADNPLVCRILRQWATLTAWMHERIQSLATGESHTSQVITMRRLTSHAGNTVDMLLTAMSPEQRESVRLYLVESNALVRFFRLLKKKNQHDGEEEAAKDDRMGEPIEVCKMESEETAEKQDREGDGNKVDDEMEGKITPGAISLLWRTEGAVHRSLLRLYLNADFFDGVGLATMLFSAAEDLTRECFYFIRVTLSKSHVSPMLSKETARFCGTFLRIMESLFLNSGGDFHKTIGNRRVFTERDAVSIVDTVFCVLDSQEIYDAFRQAYLGGSPLTQHYKLVWAKLSTPMFSPVQPLPSPQRRQPVMTTAVLGTSSGYAEQLSSEAQQKLGPFGVRWKPEWTAAMRNYPRTGEPFTPLPIGWTSALSRSYGHYYFRKGKGTATYKHPTDETEFMVTPQSFLLEPGTSVTLSSVVDYSNTKLSEAASRSLPEGRSHISMERAQEWLQDQRIRMEALDLATLDLLKITYRVGGCGSGRSSGGHQAADSADGKHDHRHRRHSRRKRSRSRRRKGKRARSREDANTTETVSHRALNFATYPPRGHPFPLLPRGWTCNLSTSKGLYYFRPPRGSPTFFHPTTGLEHRGAPQAFVLHCNVQALAIATAAKRPIEEVEKWLMDQRLRDEDFDAATMRIIPVSYVRLPQDDERYVNPCEDGGHSHYHRRDSRHKSERSSEESRR